MTTFAPLPISVPPGLYSDTTDLDAEGRWVDGSNVRFWKGRPRRVGGWSLLLDSANTSSPIRGMKVWNTSAGARWIAFGSADGLYLFDGTEYDITPSGWTTGSVDAANPTGYGGGTYGTGWFAGTNLFGVSTTPPTIWSMDNFGDDLLVVPIGEGNLYHWDASVGTGTPAAVVSGAPTGNLGVLVTDDRHCMLFGAGGNPLKVQWSDQEDFTNWTVSTTTTAGAYTLEAGSKIMGWAKTGQGIIVVTDRAAYILRYIGGNYTFSRTRIGMECGCVGPQAIVGLDSGAYWMGTNAFFTFNGRVNRLPCDVRNAVYRSINSYQAAKIVAGTNSQFDEITWFYPSTSDEIDAYVTYSPSNGWSKGTLARTAWVDASGILFANPMAGTSDGKIYSHDVTGTAESLSWSLKIALQSAQSGAQHIWLRKFLPDWDQQDGDIDITFNVYNSPEDTVRTKGPFTISPGQGEVSVRARGHFVGFTMTGEDEFVMGSPRILAKATGGRV